MTAAPLASPDYVHDCERCVYVGKHYEFDLYVCQGADIIARYGNEPSENKSSDFGLLKQIRRHSRNEWAFKARDLWMARSR